VQLSLSHFLVGSEMLKGGGALLMASVFCPKKRPVSGFAPTQRLILASAPTC